MYIRSVDICSVVVWSYAGDKAANWVKMKFTLPGDGGVWVVWSGALYAHHTPLLIALCDTNTGITATAGTQTGAPDRSSHQPA